MSENLKREEDWFVYYVASPYSSPDVEVRKERYALARKAAKTLSKIGVAAFVPIAYDGLWDLDPDYNLVDHSWNFWEKIDLPILDRCAALILFEIPGWEKSKGVAGELEHCRKMGIPVLSISVQDLDDEEVLKRKIALLEGMVKQSRRVVGPRFEPDTESSRLMDGRCITLRGN